MVSKTVVSIKFWIIKHQIISTVYFPHQTGIIIHATIPKLDRLSAEQKLLEILFCLRQLETLLDFIWLTASSTFGNNVSGLKLLTRLCVGFSHLREHKFKHNFQDTLNPLCPCSLEAEDTYHFFMRCQNFSNQRNVLFDDLNSINSEILKMSENEIVQVLLFGDKSFSKDMNFRIITSSIRFIKDSKRFDESLSFWEKFFWQIFTATKIWNISSSAVSVFYVTYLLWRPVRLSFLCAYSFITLVF